MELNITNPQHIAALLAHKVEKEIQNWIISDSPLMDVFNTIPTTTYEGYTTIKHYYQWSHGFNTSWALPMQRFPEQTQSDYDYYEVDICKGQAAMYFTGEALDTPVRTIQDPNGSAWNFLEKAIKDTRLSMAMMNEITAWGNGTGELCQVTSTNSVNNSITVDDAKFVRPQMLLMGVNYLTNQIVAEKIRVIDVIDKNIFTVEGDISSVDSNTKLFFKDSWDPKHKKVPVGLRGHISDVNPEGRDLYQGKDRAVYHRLRAYVDDTISGNPDEDFDILRVSDFLDTINNRCGTIPDYCFFSQKAANHYYKVLESKNKPTLAMPNKTGMPGNLVYVHNGKEITLNVMKYCPDHDWYFMNKNSMHKYVGVSGFLRDGGSHLSNNFQFSNPGNALRLMNEHHAYSIFAVWWFSLFNNCPWQNGVMLNNKTASYRP